MCGWKQRPVRREDAMLYAAGFEEEKGSTGHGIQMASRNWKKQESGLSPEERMQH